MFTIRWASSMKTIFLLPTTAFNFVAVVLVSISRTSASSPLRYRCSLSFNTSRINVDLPD